ncbi:protein L-isoaspartate O-methyltransferase [Geotalea daltonii FRC-32]|uniref:Protein-L-isoaspartate O-methyltransferase n=1 Tax=Geotalea daltonii (strain DSM 22248 / JCM 15807 / FRC-32) TaxID=316067 RepID=B9M694_GEODF|nr:protein-L-isoaspartate(D-aspartate) O-methyltransferase [Geotalea daltonii]ACM21882.1 protein L-isoaspartate O-methyltransferase [Geotalea daltonii FRC-32]
MIVDKSMAVHRERMIKEHLIARGISDEAVLKAMGDVPREVFVMEGEERLAYEDYPLPISHGQTISQPYMVAYMTESLELSSEDTVLEIGTGSGYAAAVLSRIVKKVYSVERIAELATSARQRLIKLGYDNIEIMAGDGSLGWPEHGPYDAIVVTAGAPELPKALLQQLKVSGRLVVPVGSYQTLQMLVRARRKSGSDFTVEELCAVRFVPLYGAEGW